MDSEFCEAQNRLFHPLLSLVAIHRDEVLHSGQFLWETRTRIRKLANGLEIHGGIEDLGNLGDGSEGLLVDGLRVERVHQHHVSHRYAVLLKEIEGQTVESLQESRVRRLHIVRMVAVEENLGGGEEFEDGNVGGILVAEDDVEVGVLDADNEGEIESANDSEQNVEAVEESAWKKISVHDDVERSWRLWGIGEWTILGFVEGFHSVMRSESASEWMHAWVHSDVMALLFQRDGGVDDESFRSADSQVRVKECDLHELDLGRVASGVHR